MDTLLGRCMWTQFPVGPKSLSLLTYESKGNMNERVGLQGASRFTAARTNSPRRVYDEFSTFYLLFYFYFILFYCMPIFLREAL